MLHLILHNLNVDYNLFLNIKNAFKPEAPQIVKEGGFIRDGFSKELDDLRNFRNNELDQITKLQTNYSEMTNVNSLKIKHNRMLGYHVEVRAMHDQSLRDIDIFIHRQTTAQTSRLSLIHI